MFGRAHCGTTGQGDFIDSRCGKARSHGTLRGGAHASLNQSPQNYAKPFTTAGYHDFSRWRGGEDRAVQVRREDSMVERADFGAVSDGEAAGHPAGNRQLAEPGLARRLEGGQGTLFPPVSDGEVEQRLLARLHPAHDWEQRAARLNPHRIDRLL